MKCRPVLEQFDAKQLLNAGALSTGGVNTNDDSRAVAVKSADTIVAHAAADRLSINHPAAGTHVDRRHLAPPGTYGYLAFRVTNTPFQTPYKLIPPFQQVIVQGRKPVPGETYNITDVAVKNGSSQTFDASDHFTVRTTNQPRSFGGFPILTGTQQWKPGQILVFYVLTKKYYPVSFVSGGFQFDLGGRSSTAVPGPSGIFLRLKFNPTTFARTLNWIVAFGQGNQTGHGAQFGLPNTSINEIVDAQTQRSDFAGHF